jgi:hypothetical protein
MGERQRELYGKRGACPAPGTVRTNGPTMQLDDLLGNCQSKSQPSMLPSCRSVTLKKSLEDSRQQFRLDE